MIKYFLAILITFFPITSAFAGATSPGIYYVSPGTLNVRMVANKTGKKIKKLRKQQEVEVFEIKGDWARISPYFDGEAKETDGAAEWVAARFLNNAQPAKTKTNQSYSSPGSQIISAIKLSDDFQKYQSVFVKASEKLISNGACKLNDFKKLGGWWQSLKHQPDPIYVTYCGGTDDSYRIYLDARTGNTFK